MKPHRHTMLQWAFGSPHDGALFTRDSGHASHSSVDSLPRNEQQLRIQPSVVGPDLWHVQTQAARRPDRWLSASSNSVIRSA